MQGIEPFGHHDCVGEGVHILRWGVSELSLILRREAEPKVFAQFIEQPPDFHAEEAITSAQSRPEGSSCPRPGR